MYTSQQLAKYFDHISFPGGDRAEQSLDYLKELQAHHQAKVPFENLSLHYSKNHVLSLDHQDLYRKIVLQGMGGYCMENNTFFGAVLRSLGFTLINAGGRVSDQTTGKKGTGYSGWSHMVNIVTIGQQRYLVDVGFGTNGPTHPLPLIPDQVWSGVAPLSQKLEYRSLPQHTDPSQRVWVYSYRLNDDSPWMEGYSFTEIEFFPEDFEVMNMSTMKHGFFTQTVLCVTTILNESGGARGLLILYMNEVKKRVGGVTIVVERLESEEQRVKALENWFGIVLDEEEKMGIVGLPTELKP